MKAWLSESWHYRLLRDRLQSIHFSVSLSYCNQKRTMQVLGVADSAEVETLSNKKKWSRYIEQGRSG